MPFVRSVGREATTLGARERGRNRNPYAPPPKVVPSFSLDPSASSARSFGCRSPKFASGGARVHSCSCSRLPRTLDECCIPMKGSVSSAAALTVAPDEVRASAGVRSAPASLLHQWKRSSEGEPRSPLEASPADECASEAQQRAVHTGVAFPADAESAEVVQPGKTSAPQPTVRVRVPNHARWRAARSPA
jgi:hypothetical protein